MGVVAADAKLDENRFCFFRKKVYEPVELVLGEENNGELKS